MNAFYITGHLWRESTVTSGLPSQRASDVELQYFLCGQSEWIIKQTVELSVIWDAMTLIWQWNGIRDYQVMYYTKPSCLTRGFQKIINVLQMAFWNAFSWLKCIRWNYNFSYNFRLQGVNITLNSRMIIEPWWLCPLTHCGLIMQYSDRHIGK